MPLLQLFREGWVRPALFFGNNPDYPTPISSPVQSLRPARAICESCHTPARYVGENLLVKSSFADDEKNTETQTALVLHLGGLDSLSQLSGIHGVHWDLPQPSRCR